MHVGKRASLSGEVAIAYRGNEHPRTLPGRGIGDHGLQRWGKKDEQRRRLSPRLPQEGRLYIGTRHYVKCSRPVKNRRGSAIGVDEEE